MAKEKKKASFLFGASTSSYQIEGAWKQDGKSLSIWDVFTHKKRISRKENGDVACDHYNRFAHDISLMDSMHLDAYRFSLSWPRLLPDGVGKINSKGVDFYNRLIDTLLEKKIRPFVTLYHWDLPYVLERKGGWASIEIIDWFTQYAATCMKLFGDRVKDWIILNEPFVFLTTGYLLGIHAPGRRSLDRFYKGSHHALLAQASAAREMRKISKKANLGTTISCTYAYPYSESKKNISAAMRFDAFWNRLYIDPVLGRGYPRELSFARKIEFYAKQLSQKNKNFDLTFDFDFWGINTYTTKLVKSNRSIPFIGYRTIKRNLEANILGWEIDPTGIGKLLDKFSAYPEVKELYITENGIPMDDVVENSAVHDQARIRYLADHIGEVLRAKERGVPVKGYFVWSLLDNFEWAEGYKPRFGLVHVNYKTQERIVKDSGYWYRDFIQKYKKRKES